MGATEIILIVIGVAVFVLGYFMPARKKDIGEEARLISEEEIRKLIADEEEHIRDKIADIVEETVSYSIEKTERAMERLTNEKIMAINEYSDTVLEEIHKNHKEVTFLYDMLNDKHDNLTSAVSEASQTAEGVRQTLGDAEITVHEAMDKADDVLRSVNEASARITDVLRAADDAVKGVWDAQNAARVAREAAQEAIRIASDLTATEKEAETAKATKTETKKSAKIETKKSAIDVLSEMKSGRETGGKAAEEPPQEQNVMISEPQEEAGEEIPAEEAVEFKPIMPKRVEIIHEPEEDTPAYAVKMPPSGAAEEIQESIPTVDLPFAKDNGRNSNERILDLHKAGKSNMAIAKELGLGLGEVKLVIDLFEGM